MKIIYPEETLAKMQEIFDDCMGDAPPYCEASCPMHTDVKGYVDLISDGEHKKALALIREKLFLPASLGRVCAHPCEDKCKQSESNHPMAIAALKRFVADRCDADTDWDTTIKTEKNSKIAIIGAGPAGAQAAIDLRKEGYKVTIFEKLQVVGGMLRVGIPAYRLPREIIDFEYSFLHKLGIEFKMGVEVGKDISFEELTTNYDFVLITVGAHKGIIIPLEGNKLEGVLDAVNFLREASLTGKVSLGEKVVVIGGGNVAIDAARTARRLGSKKVHLVCLEKKEEMPAHDWEVAEAEEEGIIVHAAFGPEKIVGDKGKVKELVLNSCITVFDAAGKFNPTFDTCIQKVLPADNIIMAIGQSVDHTFLPKGMLELQPNGRIKVDPVTLQTSLEKVFAAGDATGGSVIVVEAMAEGRKAATSIIRDLNGLDMHLDREHEGAYETWLETELDEDEPVKPRVAITNISPEKRIQSFVEVALGFTEEQALEEASRCLACECKHCMQECEMLNDFADCPKDIFAEILRTGEIDPLIPYSCNVCNQCTIVCPKEFKLSENFMAMRVEMVKANNGKSPIAGHKAIEMHQLLAFSKIFGTTKPAPKGKELS